MLCCVCYFIYTFSIFVNIYCKIMNSHCLHQYMCKCFTRLIFNTVKFYSILWFFLRHSQNNVNLNPYFWSKYDKNQKKKKKTIPFNNSAAFWRHCIMSSLDLSAMICKIYLLYLPCFKLKVKSLAIAAPQRHSLKRGQNKINVCLGSHAET